MEEYLLRWWNGELAQFYQPLGLEIAQLNKLFKIAQYMVGLMAIFEVILFAKLMERAKIIFYTYIFYLKLASLVCNIHNLLLRLIVGIALVILGKKGVMAFLKSVFVEHYLSAADEANQDASSSLLVLFFNWLERHPISEKNIKISAFSFLVIFSFGELLTSQ